MLELLENLAPVRKVDRHPGAVEVAVDIPAAEEGIGAQLAQLLRAAAAGVASFVGHRDARDSDDPGDRE